MASMATRKTRGPRTPHERACDAARSAATLLERTDNDELHAVATMLRFEYEGQWDRPGRLDASAAARRLLMDEWGFVEEIHHDELSARRLHHAEAMIEWIRPKMDEILRTLGLDSATPEPALSIVRGGDDA